MKQHPVNCLVIRYPHLVGFLGLGLTGVFLLGFFVDFFFSNTAKLEIYDTCSQGHESTFLSGRKL